MEVSETAKGGHPLASMTEEEGLTLLPQTIEKQTKDLTQCVQTQDNGTMGQCLLRARKNVMHPGHAACSVGSFQATVQKRGPSKASRVLKGRNSADIQGSNNS